MALRFSPWYPLAPDAIEVNTPCTAGIFELRVYGPLLVYPKGRSAMVLYGSTNREVRSLREALHALGRRGLPDRARHAVGSSQVYFRTAPTNHPEDDLKKRLADFEMRFGSYPIGNV